MSQHLRSIAPAPSSKREGPQRNPPTQDLHPAKRRPLISAACRPCQRRKIKCDGRRPTCSACASARLDCEWDTEPGITRGASVRLRNATLEGALSTTLEAFWYLKTKPAEDTRALLDKIRASSDVSTVLEYLNVQRHHESRGQMAWEALGMAEHEPDSTTLEGAASSSEPLNKSSIPANVSSRSSREKNTAEDQLFQLDGHVNLAIFADERTLQILRSGIHAFNAYTAMIFFVFDKGELEQIQAEVQDGIRSQGVEWMWGRSHEDTFARRSMLAELCAAAALGLQYHDEPAYQGLSPEPQVSYLIDDVDAMSRTFYRISKSLLDDSTEFSPYRALKLCALLGMYNVMEHSSVALAYTNLGLTFASDYGLYSSVPPMRMSNDHFISNRKTLRTVAVIRSWLTATLGYVPGTGIDIRSSDIQIPIQGENESIESIIQRKVMEATIVAANLVRTASSFGVMGSPVLKDIDAEIHQWDQGISEELQMENMMQMASPFPTWFNVGLYMHLLHFSTSVLKGRSVHASQRPHTVTDVHGEMVTAVVESIQGARSCARVLERMLDENLVFRKSWMCISAAHCAANTLLWCSSRSMLSSQPHQIWQQDLKSALLCLRLLDFCSPRHKVASLYRQSLQPYYDIIQEAAMSLNDGTMDTPSSERRKGVDVGRENIPPLSVDQSTLQKANHELHMILARPFSSSPQDLLMGAAGTVDEATVHSRLNWTTHVTSVFNGQASPQLLSRRTQNRTLYESLADIGGGYFVDSQEPHGWSGLGH